MNAVPDGGGECPAVADELRVQHDITTRLLFSNNNKGESKLISLQHFALRNDDSDERRTENAFERKRNKRERDPRLPTTLDSLLNAAL